MNKMYNSLVQLFGPDNFIRGMNYEPKYIKLINSIDSYFKTVYFEVKSENYHNVYYDVEINSNVRNKTIVGWECTCQQFAKTNCCKHIVASYLKYKDYILEEKKYDMQKVEMEVSKRIFDKFYKPKTKQIKKKLKLEVTLTHDCSYYSSNERLMVKLRIGEDRLYALGNKMGRFLGAYKNGESYVLTTKFTYNPDKHYFAENDKKIIDFFVKNYKFQKEYLNETNIDEFMEFLENRKFYILNQGEFNGIENSNPFEINLTKVSNNYNLSFAQMDDYQILYKNGPYIYKDNIMYKINDKILSLYTMINSYNLNSMTFKRKDLEKFTEGILPIIKDNIVIDDEITDIVITNTPTCKLYFDFYYNSIECKVELLYGNKKVGIFGNTTGVLRNDEYEGNILERLSTDGFIIYEDVNQILLDDEEKIGEFLEFGLDALAQEYEVFTSQKVKDTEVVKNAKAAVNFSIGKDNIMSYDFNVEGADSLELSSILDSVRLKKKYYRLKSGQILNLQTEKIQELKKLTEDMELTNKQINLGTGEIPKYRAIYFDSLKKNRYKNIISTNNMFDKLIERFNAYKNNDINLSKKELSILRDYQITGVKWLYNIYKCGFGGILADEMGLGKSVQLIYLIKLIMKENKGAKVLIVAPTSLVYNWENEFKKFGPELKYKVFAENKEQRNHDLDNISDIDVLITTYGLVRNDFEKYQNMNFELLAIDEAQSIKNVNTQITKVIKSLKANTKIALTGTPLENSVMELWSIFDFIMPGYLASNKKFQSLYNIKEIDDDQLHKLDTLNMQIKYFILRRKKKDVVMELPDKIENNIYIELGKNQKRLYASLVEKTKKELDELVKEVGFKKASFKILQLLTRLRQMCIDPSIVYDGYEGGSAKIEELLKIVKETKENGHKMLIFTSYKTVLDIVLKEFSKASISAYHIDGSVSSKKRMELVDKFNSDDTDAFIITLKAGGTGLNLTSATVVIHLDLWWNPQVENQATDRAHRIGQKNTVEVIRLIAKGTIEERILELQNKKKKLAEALIEGDMKNENQFSSLTENDIKLLLSMDNDMDI